MQFSLEIYMRKSNEKKENIFCIRNSNEIFFLIFLIVVKIREREREKESSLEFAYKKYVQAQFEKQVYFYIEKAKEFKY
jgi:hypothetical protein